MELLYKKTRKSDSLGNQERNKRVTLNQILLKQISGRNVGTGLTRWLSTSSNTTNNKY